MVGAAQFNVLFDVLTITLTADGSGSETESSAVTIDDKPGLLSTLPSREVVVDEQIVHIKRRMLRANLAEGSVSTDQRIDIGGVIYDIVDKLMNPGLTLELEQRA